VITVQARAAGRKRSIVPDFQLPPLDSERSAGSPLTLRDLITRIVIEQVGAFRSRQRDNRFLRALSGAEIAQAAETGAVRSGGSDLDQEVDEDVAIATALQAFDDGLYYVLIDRRQYEGLDEQVFVGEDSTVVFLRLVPLAGG
jgi:hypothetical protein